MSKLIVKAITEHYGERCPDYDEDCFCCKVWSEYDALTTSTRCDELKTVAYEVYGHNEQPKLREAGLTSYEKDWGFSAVELVTRQNAEEMIAAKDRTIDRQEKALRDNIIITDALEADNKRLREALEPFAEYGEDYFDKDHNGNPLPDEQGVGWIYMNFGNFRKARAALGEVKP